MSPSLSRGGITQYVFLKNGTHTHEKEFRILADNYNNQYNYWNDTINPFDTKNDDITPGQLMYLKNTNRRTSKFFLNNFDFSRISKIAIKESNSGGIAFMLKTTSEYGCKFTVDHNTPEDDGIIYFNNDRNIP